MSAPGSNPAFPITPEIWATHPDFFGLTKREWFAGQALAGLCSNQAIINGCGGSPQLAAQATWTGKFALQVADAVLSAQEAGQ